MTATITAMHSAPIATPTGWLHTAWAWVDTLPGGAWPVMFAAAATLIVVGYFIARGVGR